MNFEDKLKILSGAKATLDILQYLMGTFTV